MSKMENKSGIWPTEDRVLVHPDPIEEKTAGGILIPEDQRKKHGMAQQAGTVVHVGPDAWRDSDMEPLAPGSRVTFARYQGEPMTGKDGELYRLVNDRQITAVIEDGVDLTDFKTREAYAA